MSLSTNSSAYCIAAQLILHDSLLEQLNPIWLKQVQICEKGFQDQEG